MQRRWLAHTAVLALALGAGSAVPASAQQGSPSQQTQSQAAPPVLALNNWNYDTAYRYGWSVERLMDQADVIGASGDDIGSVENVIIGNRGHILGIIAQVGGFWDIGDTHVFVPWEQVQVSRDLERVVVPIREDNVDQYAGYANDVLRRAATGRTHVVDDDLATGPRIWKATDLIDDYAYLNDQTGYGYVNDLIFTPDGNLHAVVVNASPGWGGGYRAFPFYGYNYGWNPNYSGYNLGYGANDVGRMNRFDYSRMPQQVPMQNLVASANQGGMGPGRLMRNRYGSGYGTNGDGTYGSGANRSGVNQGYDQNAATTGAVATQWTFRNIDSDRNLELTNREFTRVGNQIGGRWDRNNNGRIDRNEFDTGLYNVFDTNRDGRVTQGEFTRSWRDWGRGMQPQAFTDLDRTGDGVLDRNEFGTGINNAGLFDRWDQDRSGDLADNEFDHGLYGVWDADQNGTLAENEFNDWTDFNWF
jgi:hypothetical protein